MKQLLPIFMVISALTTSTWAGFINNKTDWDGMISSQKHGYLIGIFRVSFI